MENLNDLMKQKTELTDRLNRIRRDLKLQLNADSGEQAIELENREVLMKLEQVESQNLATIERKIQALTHK